MTHPDNIFQIGPAIRKLREERRITGEQLGKLVGMSQPKISRIETNVGRNVRPGEIETILNVLKAPQTIRQQFALAANTTNNLTFYRTNAIRHQSEKVYELERKTKRSCIFVTSLIPALLQTVDYRRTLLKPLLPPGDLTNVLRTSIKRQDLLFEPQKQYHFILSETALYTRVVTRHAQQAQLDRLERLQGLTNIKIGIVPLETGLLPIDACSFAIRDNQTVSRVMSDGDIYSPETGIVAVYHRLFTELERKADYSDAALELIHKAQRYFQ